MTKPAFNPEIIGELRKRVAAHNEIVAASHPAMVVKLSGVKKLYKRWFSGPDPHAHALAMLDGRLLSMQTAALGGLEKARRPFDQGRHPRGRGGEFRPTGRGGGGGRPPVGPIGGAGRGDDGDDALLQAAQTQVIPETRYSLYGPPIAAASGLVYGAVQGASARPGLPWQGGGSLPDRVATSVVGFLGRGAGKLGGLVTRDVAIEVPRDLSRRAIPRINRALGTSIPRPSSTAGRALGARIVGAAERGGRATGRLIGHGLSLTTYPAAQVGRGVALYHGPIAGRVAAGVIGAALPGALTAGSLHHVATSLGPYLDARFPRRVKKLAGPLWDAPEVLAKQAELLTHADLAKAMDSSEELAKAVGGAAMARVLRTLRFLRGPAARAYDHPPAPPPTYTPPQLAAREAFRARQPHFTVSSHRAARMAYIGAHVAGLSVAGAGIGALTGATLASFAQQHPRDPRTGQFRTKGQAARAGAIHGAVAGAGLGLMAGLVGARTGHAKLLRDAVGRLRGEQLVEGTSIPAAMQTETEAIARRAHAHAFLADNPKAKIPPQPPDSVVPPHEHIIEHLGNNAVTKWLAEEGDAMRAGPQVWIRKQLDDAFDAHIRREIGRLPNAEDRVLPVVGKDLPHLIDSVDEEALRPEQRKIWDKAAKLHMETMDEVEKVYVDRAKQAETITTKISELHAEKRHLESEIENVPKAWETLRTTAPAPSMSQLRLFARRIDHKPAANVTREQLVTDIQNHLMAWDAHAGQRVEAIDAEVTAAAKSHQEVVASQRDSLSETEQQRIRNPFSRTKERFFKPRLKNIETEAGFNEIKQAKRDAATKDFKAGQTASVAAALTHLQDMSDVAEAALVARIPQNNLFVRYLAAKTPELMGHIKQGADDFRKLAGAHREALSGELKDFYTFLHANTDPAEAWRTAKNWSKAAWDFWQTGPGKWLRENYGKVITTVGVMSAIGMITVDQKGKRRLQLDPAKWHLPRDLDYVYEHPSPLRKPHEAVIGIKYRDRQNRERFLNGIYVKSADGKDYQDIRYGSAVDTVLAQARGGGGGGDSRQKPVDVDNAEAVDKAINEAENKGHIVSVGPAGFEFQQRQSKTEGGDQERDVSGAFYKQYVGRLQGIDESKSNPNHEDFYNSLRALFEQPRIQFLTEETRARFLFGHSKEKRHRGILANQQKIYQSGDKARIAGELRAQINMPGARPQNADEYTQMHRVLWFAGEHFNLSDGQRDMLLENLNNSYRQQTKQEPPTEQPQEDTSYQTMHEAIDAAMGGWRRTERPTAWRDDAVLRSELQTTYETGARVHRQQNPNASARDVHLAGVAAVEAAVDRERDLNAAEPMGDLYKLFGLTKLYEEQRHPRGRGGLWRGGNAPPAIGAISGAHLPQPASPGPQSAGEFAHMGATRPTPSSPGMAPTEAAPGGAFHQAVRPQHVLGQIGTYGLSQVGWDAIGNIASHFSPGGGMVANATKFGLKTLGSFGGSVYGLKGGQALGRQIGDRAPMAETPEQEGVVRGVAGGMGQIAYNEFAQSAVRRGVAVGTARILGGAAGTALDPFIGPAGTILGSALAGALTDEGAGILYRHLSRYGRHVPAHALKHFHHRGASA